MSRPSLRTAPSGSWPLIEDTGAVLWTHEWDTTYRMLMMSYATGPRATPTVDGDRVYLTGATGRIFSLDAATGEVIWEEPFRGG